MTSEKKLPIWKTIPVTLGLSSILWGYRAAAILAAAHFALWVPPGHFSPDLYLLYLRITLVVIVAFSASKLWTYHYDLEPSSPSGA